MQRRKFVKTVGAGAAVAATVAAPALAQGQPELKWRLASSFPKSLDTLWGGAELFCRRVGELTDGRFKVQPFASGEIVPTPTVAEVSPCIPSTYAVTSMLTMSPSARGRSSGIPWQSTSFTDVQIDLGKPW